MRRKRNRATVRLWLLTLEFENGAITRTMFASWAPLPALQWAHTVKTREPGTIAHLRTIA